MIVSVTGASGFIGGHLLTALSRSPDFEVRALTRRERKEPASTTPGVHWHQGSLEDADALRRLVARDGTLIHLAYPSGWSHDRQVAAAARMGDIARETGLKRLVLSSTAVVAGTTRETPVTEATRCEPSLDYERTKLEIERTIAAKAEGTFELAVLRPTAVFGPGGRNLLKLAEDLTRGRSAVNWVRSSLYGRRRMNLVCVENVVGALIFLVQRDRLTTVETYIVSDDDDPKNNFRDVEAVLMRHLGVAPYPVQPPLLPPSTLSLAIKLAGRSSTDPSRVYDGSRLTRNGWRKPATFGEALVRFAEWFKHRQ